MHAIVSACGAQPVPILSPSFEVMPGPRVSLALVVLDPDGATNPLSTIRVFKQHDVETLAITPPEQRLSLTTRCHVLLAGAIALLDAGSQDFAIRVQDWILQRMAAQQLQVEECERLRNRMREMQLVGESASLLQAFRKLLKVSTLSDVPVLISGESGTGKELFAHALQRLDPKRCHAPLVSLNCAAISTSLMESELFGHRKGSFTGAERHRKGLIRSADGGTLFLDEVGELELGLQAKLLRVLQESRVLGVGEDQEVPVDIRVIAATNRPLEEMVRARTFREDLYHRLNVISIVIPPLRERVSDIRLLVEYFLRKHSSIAAGGEVLVSSEFVHALERLPLHGNARELENIVRQALFNKADSDEVNLLDLPQEVWRSVVDAESPSTVPAAGGGSWKSIHEASDNSFNESELFQSLLATDATLSDALRRCEKLLLQAALRRAQGNQTQTARLLGITPRSVYNKLRRHNLAA